MINRIIHHHPADIKYLVQFTDIEAGNWLWDAQQADYKSAYERAQQLIDEGKASARILRVEMYVAAMPSDTESAVIVG